MNRWTMTIAGAVAIALSALAARRSSKPTDRASRLRPKPPAPELHRDAVQEAQTPRRVSRTVALEHV
jgi:hypothetical protein